ncbi:MAG: translocation/assembly module TamB domain-containing protein [Prevotella sp.]|nr:translocation/assembly module TamB domain-containing protein [Prevotella sp.]
MKKALKWIGAAVLIPILLFALLAGLLYFPPFQQWAVRQASSYASEKTGLNISVGTVRLKFPLDLRLDDVVAVQPPGDTIASIGSVVADVQLRPLLKKQVVIDELTFEQARVNTADFIQAARVRGDVGKLRVTNSDVFLNGKDDPSVSDVNLSNVLLSDARLDVVLADSVPEDTTESETSWRIFAEKAKIENSDIKLTMPAADGPTQVTAHLGQAEVSSGVFDLKRGSYSVGSVSIDGSALAYDSGSGNQSPADENRPGGGVAPSEIDFSHLKMSDLSLKADSISYNSSPSSGSQLSANLRSLSFREQSGLDVRNVSGRLAMADERLKLTDGKVETSESSLSADFDMALNAFAEQEPGTMKATVHAALGKQDLMRFMGSLPKEFRQRWPGQQLRVDGVVRGNMQNMGFSDLTLSLPTAFKATASGHLENLQSLTGDDPSAGSGPFRADIDFNARGENLDFVRELLPPDVKSQVRIPRGVTAQGNVKANGQQYAADVRAGVGKGTLVGTVKLDADRMAYEAHVKTSQLPLQQVLPDYGLSPITATIDATGTGTDLLSPRTQFTAKADISQFSYGGRDLSGLTADATVRNGKAHARLTGDNSLLKGTATVDALMGARGFKGTVVADLAHADLQRLGLVDSMMTVSGCAHLDIDSDLKHNHKIQGSVGDLAVSVREYPAADATSGGEVRPVTRVFRPGDLWLDLLSRRDTTRAVVDCGDFHMALAAGEGYEQLMKAGTELVAEVNRQYADRTIDQQRLRSVLPSAQLSLSSGRDNFFVEMLNHYGYGLGELNCQLSSAPATGLNGRLHAEAVMVDSILLDTLNFNILTDSVRTTYQAQIRNNKKNPQYTFNALIDGVVHDKGTIFGTRLYDENGELGVRLGLQATMERDGFMLRTYGNDPVLGYRKFHVNDSNYIFLGPKNRVSADLVMRADDGTGIQVYTNDDNDVAQQDITLSLHHFDLEKILAVIPYTPDISGMMDGDFHVLKTDDEMSVSTTIDVKKMAYEKSPMGDVGAEFVYMPKNDGSHYVDGILTLDGGEVANLSGTYKADGQLDADVSLERFPLSLANGFIPDQIVGLEGYGEGELSVKGQPSKPVVNGEVYLDSAFLVSVPYGVRLRFDNDPVTITDSRLLFENFNMYSSSAVSRSQNDNSSPLTTYGSLDFSDPSHMRLDMKMRAQNFLLIDSKENPRSEAYGKAYVNFFGTIAGEVTNLLMRGKLDVLGTTDITYILRDTPLTTDNQLEGLVTFTDFSDSTQTVVNRPELAGFSMDMTVDVSKGAHVMAYLNTDKSNYIDLMGGGTLRMAYNNADKLRLTGRYTLANGEMKYSLPIIPLKTFTIQDGSNIEFTGDPMNPTLNITATESVKTAVSSSNGVGRSVEFDCGVIITKTLNDMGLEFTLSAPEDMQLQSELLSMSKEQRGKLAVTMLTTGMYLADGNTGGFTMNNALNSFLQSEINNITGNALRTLDFSVGLDNTIDATGNTSTNYSFKFAKRFWNNRLKVSLGGKVSTGAEIESQNQSFFDNVTFEYRLDDTANKYVTLFYENNVYDWLDGFTQEYGAGFIWRRSLQHFKDVFNLRGDRQLLPVVAPTDSLRRQEAVPSVELPDSLSVKETP